MSGRGIRNVNGTQASAAFAAYNHGISAEFMDHHDKSYLVVLTMILQFP